MVSRIDSYHYSKSYDRDKMYYYENHTYTKDEQEKIDSLREKILEFEKIVRGNDTLPVSIFCPESHIVYFEDKGYISFVNSDKDIVDIYYYGRTENEALISALINYELTYNIDIELQNREELIKEYKKRFPNRNEEDEEYDGSFFSSELSLKDFRKYYGDQIPSRLVKYYEDSISRTDGIEYQYDYDTDGFILKDKMT